VVSDGGGAVTVRAATAGDVDACVELFARVVDEGR
jgi:hypothetical protein